MIKNLPFPNITALDISENKFLKELNCLNLPDIKKLINKRNE